MKNDIVFHNSPISDSGNKKVKRVSVKLAKIQKGQLAQMPLETLGAVIKDLKGREEPENVEILSTAIEIYMEKMKHLSPQRRSLNSQNQIGVHTTPMRTSENPSKFKENYLN